MSCIIRLLLWMCLLGWIGSIANANDGLPRPTPMGTTPTPTLPVVHMDSSNLPTNMVDASAYATRSSQRRQKQALEEEQKKQRRLARKGLQTNTKKSAADQGDREVQENGSGGSANESNENEPEGGNEDEEEDEEEIDEYASDILPTSMTQSSTPKKETIVLKQLVTEAPLERKTPPLPRRRQQTLFDEYEDDYEDDEEEGQDEQQQEQRTSFKRRRGRYYRLGMRSLSTSWQSLTTSTRNTFSKMVYKGVGISLVKPIGGNWKSFGIGVKIPITNHFPLYDSNICLPRLIAFVGVNYPLSYKVSFTLSVPIQAVQIYLLVLSQANPDQWPQVKATDNVKRLGLTWSLKIPAKFPTNKIWYQALTSSWSPAFNFVPGSKLVQAILPFLLFTPTLLLAMILYFLSFGQEMTRFLSNPFVRRKGECQIKNQCQSPVVQSVAAPGYVSSFGRSASNTPISATRLYSNSNKDIDMVLDPLLRGKQGESTWQLENSMLTRFENATQIIQRWMSQRSTALGSALGYSNRMHTLSVNMDFQPFYLLFLRQFVMSTLILADRVLFACLDAFFYAIFALNQRMIQWRKRGGLFAKRSSAQSPSSSGMNAINPTSMSYERVGSFTPSADSMVNPREFASRLKAKQQQQNRQGGSQWRGGNSHAHENNKSSARNLSQPSGLLARVSSSRVSNRSRERRQNDPNTLR